MAYPAATFEIDRSSPEGTAKAVISAYQALNESDKARLCGEAHDHLCADDGWFAVSITADQVQLGFHTDCLFAAINPDDLAEAARIITEMANQL
ncbi:hypothetical protein [Acidiphilium sp. PM]|uniref:hypothetical protein n=1 Tax=Acidiphilium sp. PM TaxID=1043206 RepID=UPI0005867261|nr:hypothetical protein [Acidiphilium sp. PM]